MDGVARHVEHRETPWRRSGDAVLTSERARELGLLSAEARRRNGPKFPRLDTPANAKLRLEIISNAALKGAITAANAGAQERLHREWRETYFAELDLRRLKALEGRVRELEQELEQARRFRRASA